MFKTFTNPTKSTLNMIKCLNIPKIFTSNNSSSRPLMITTNSTTNYYSTTSIGGGSSHGMKVSVIGAAGKIGQPLCLMLKQSPLIDELCVHDVVPTSGFAMELNHVDTNCKVQAYTGRENLEAALNNSKIVVILASAPEADLLTFDKMWSPNAQIVQEIVTLLAKQCPKALLAIGTNPINSLVPMACELLKKSGSFNPQAIFGVTSLDTVRANTFVAQVQGVDPECVQVPVIGGHTEETIVPVLSNAKPCSEFNNEELENITMNIRKAHENILRLKCAETAPLSSAFSTARFVISLVKAIRGYPDILESAFVPSKVHPQLKYLSTPLLLGSNGVAKNLGIPKLSDFETCLFDNAIPTLIADIKRGEKFAGVQDPPPCDPCDPSINAPKCPRNWCEFKKEQNRDFAK